MIERYSRSEMLSICSEQNKYQSWLDVEILACEAWGELGVIPKVDVLKIKENAQINIARILEIDYMLDRFTTIVKNLTVFPENMQRNMENIWSYLLTKGASISN